MSRSSIEIQAEIDQLTSDRESIKTRLKALRAEKVEAVAAEEATAAEALGRELIRANADGPEALARFLDAHGIEVKAPKPEPAPAPEPEPEPAVSGDGWGGHHV